MIQLNGYEPTISNKVYTKNASLIIPNKGDLRLKAVILPQTFIQPTNEQVVDLIKEKARYCINNWRSMEVLLEHNQLDDLERAVCKFTYGTLEKIASADEKTIMGIKAHSIAQSPKKLENRNRVLFLRYGFIPAEQMERAGNVDKNWYVDALLQEELLDNDLGERVFIDILMYNDDLPPKTEIKMLVKHRTYHSETLDIHPFDYDAQEVGFMLDAIYPGLSGKDNVAKLDDISQQVLHEEALGTVNEIIDTVEQDAENTPPAQNGCSLH